MFKYEEKPINGSELIKLVQIIYGQARPTLSLKFLPLAWMTTTSQENILLELIPKKDYLSILRNIKYAKHYKQGKIQNVIKQEM